MVGKVGGKPNQTAWSCFLPTTCTGYGSGAGALTEDRPYQPTGWLASSSDGRWSRRCSREGIDCG